MVRFVSWQDVRLRSLPLSHPGACDRFHTSCRAGMRMVPGGQHINMACPFLMYAGVSIKDTVEDVPHNGDGADSCL